MLRHPAELGGWTSPFKAAARAVGRAGKAVERGAVSTVKAPVKGVRALHLRPPWEGVGFGRPGWVGRLGQRLATTGIPIVGVLCNMKKYRNSRACHGIGVVSWFATKRAIEVAFAMQPGQLDEAESVLDGLTSSSPAAQVSALERRGIPSDAAAALVANHQQPTWWEQFLDALGLR